MSKQQSNIKGLIMNIDNRFNEIVSSFVLFSNKFSPRDRLIDIFPSYFSFHSSNRKSKKSLHNLDNITLQVSANLQSAIVVSDTSIKNQVATSIAYIYVHNNPVIKTIHHAINITTTKAELFTIRCSIN